MSSIYFSVTVLSKTGFREDELEKNSFPFSTQ